jgi:hypothetical protein
MTKRRSAWKTRARRGLPARPIRQWEIIYRVGSHKRSKFVLSSRVGFGPNGHINQGSNRVKPAITLPKLRFMETETGTTDHDQ